MRLPINITISPRCWFGHDWRKWDAYDDDDILKPYGWCWTCGKEKFWEPEASEGTEVVLTGHGLATIDDLGFDLPVVIVDDDFAEHLEEMGFEESIDVVDFVEQWEIWAEENVERR